MTQDKKSIRRLVRSHRASQVKKRAHNREAERGGLKKSWDAAVAALTDFSGRDTDYSPERDAEDFLAALFVPTEEEPDIREIIASSQRALLPVLTDLDGHVLPYPAWALHEGGVDVGLVQPRASLPAQPSGAVGDARMIADTNIILIAALTVDESGTRVGMGAGWYDRALTHVRPGTPVVAAVFDDEILPAHTLPREKHDYPVNAVITPSRMIVCASSTGCSALS